MTCNMIIVGLKEYETISNLTSVIYENTFLFISLILILSGQISLIYTIVKKINWNKLNIIHNGILSLILALIIIGGRNTYEYGNVCIITILTITPFLGFSDYFYYLYFKMRKLHKNDK
jgi:hypothetical protein